MSPKTRIRGATVALLASLGAGCGAVAPSPAGCSGPYPDQAVSAYVLPWRVGEAYRVGQGNCGPGSHAPGSVVQYAYDFLMPVGTPVVAAREGTVLLVQESFADGTRVAGQENYVNVVHADGSIAGYVHLIRDGAFVQVGQTVARGEVIGLSGDSGSSSEPHLHFHVQACDGCGTVPVVFGNTRPHPHGLVAGEVYAAEPTGS
jgi:murein DD-endopeptidase MepM/ murein hydrolase activator NlpD